MSWADLMQCALISEKYLMIGDPGQIPPVVSIDVRRWIPPSRAARGCPEVVLAEPELLNRSRSSVPRKDATVCRTKQSISLGRSMTLTSRLMSIVVRALSSFPTAGVMVGHGSSARTHSSDT